MSVVVTSWLRDPHGAFVPLGSAQPASCAYISGSIVLEVGGVEVLSLELWDDIDWLWPFVVQAFDDCRTLGAGERYFPSQPLLFRAESLGKSGLIRVSVSGGEIHNSAVGPGGEIFQAVGEAVLAFYGHLRDCCPPDVASQEIIDTAASWLDRGCTS